MEAIHVGKRWGGADWADQRKLITIIGAGGIGSFAAFALARNGHDLMIVDGDNIDVTNISGGQMFTKTMEGMPKPEGVKGVCREFGCVDNDIDYMCRMWNEKDIPSIITIGALDNMAARKIVFETWKSTWREEKESLFIDGRLTIEMFEIFAIKGGDEDAIREYEEKHLFSDEEAMELECTTKQSTFAAMGIASFITATVCNFLTNKKIGEEMRDVPFYQRMFFPSSLYTSTSLEPIEGIVEQKPEEHESIILSS